MIRVHKEEEKRQKKPEKSMVKMFRNTMKNLNSHIQQQGQETSF
jgi:hypothetical protein